MGEVIYPLDLMRSNEEVSCYMSAIENALQYVKLRSKKLEEFPFESGKVICLAREGLKENKGE